MVMWIRYVAALSWVVGVPLVIAMPWLHLSGTEEIIGSVTLPLWGIAYLLARAADKAKEDA